MDLTKILLVESWGDAVWGFPRGKINQGESEVDCAIREVLEETGFDIHGMVSETDFIEVENKYKSVKLFLVSGIPENIEFSAQTRKEIGVIFHL